MIPLIASVGLLLPPIQQSASRELRGVWISAGEFASIEARGRIADAMHLIADSGANAVFPPAWAAGVAIFPCTPLEDVLGIQPGERDFLSELVVEAHRRGLEIVPWFEPTIACTPEMEVELLKRKPEIFVRGKDGKLVLANGAARIDVAAAAGGGLVEAVVVEACTKYDLDGIVGLESAATLREKVLQVDPALVVAEPPSLPALDAPGTEERGDRLISLGRLLEKDGELARVLRGSRWAEEVLLPWRERTWRRPSQILEPFAGAGTWLWAEKEGEPRLLVMDGGESGHVTWTFTPPETGVYLLYAWIPLRDDQTSRASYRLAWSGGSRTAVVDASEPRNRGWKRLGDVRLEGDREIEIARLLAEEPDATKITAAGPLLPILSRRAARR